VTGKCTFLTDGYAVRLERAEPQGINPAILLLNRIVSPLPVWRLKWCRKLQLYGQFENGVYDALKAM
jgi:hypothetical protein